MNEEEARRMRIEGLQHGLFPSSSEIGRKWRNVVELAESRDAKAICLALELLAASVHQPDAWDRFDLDRPGETPGEVP